ncbi:MAG: hypothetical protein JW814_11860 [Candidatus Krumholzibacteriota bacterium]|nr:hypothetical protein [Candidatus Krumholzibacteriota bacterium]
MKIGQAILEFLIIFVIAFCVSSGVSFLWNLLFHGMAIVDWETSSRLGVILGVIGPYVISRSSRSAK